MSNIFFSFYRLAAESSIIQIAAKNMETSESFNRFVIPESGSIPSQVSKLTGIEMHGNGTMYYNLQPVTATNANEALDDFTKWLKNYEAPLIVAQNAQFDARILVSSLCRLDKSDQFSKVVAGFSDSLKLLKVEMPGKSSYKLSVLADEILEDGSTNAHNAEEDVTMLSAILLKGVPKVVEKMKRYTFTFESVLLNKRKLSNKKKASIELFRHNSEQCVVQTAGGKSG